MKLSIYPFTIPISDTCYQLFSHGKSQLQKSFLSPFKRSKVFPKDTKVLKSLIYHKTEEHCVHLRKVDIYEFWHLKIFVEKGDKKSVKAHTEIIIHKQTDQTNFLNCSNSLFTGNTQTHPSPVSRRVLSSPAHIRIDEGFSGSCFPSQTCTKVQRAHCCAHWLTQQVPGEMLGQQLVDTSSQRQKTPPLWGLSFRITHWSLFQCTLPSLSKGH